ncbi:MAG: hypothetical protein ACKV2Q_12675 [Planctomycetaceae bacterium]
MTPEAPSLLQSHGRFRPVVLVLLLAVGLTGFGISRSAPRANEEPAKTSESTAVSKPTAKVKEDNTKEVFSGKVVNLQEALKRRGVKASEEFQSQVVLESDSGELIPIVPDWRGRAFYQDERLRDRRVDLVGTRQKAAPYLQVLMIFVFDDAGTRQYMDYWCDICSIPMYEIKPCDCCQAENRLRTQPQELPVFVKKKP